MRALIGILLLLLCHSYAHAYQFVFKNGKQIQGSILYEDSSIYRIVDAGGLEMRLRKSELNFQAMASLNISVDPQEEPVIPKVAPVPESATKRTVHVYTNRDVRKIHRTGFVPPNPESEQAWLKSLSKLERDYVRLQGACRGAGTGPNLSKILKTHTYDVKGRKVQITAYWADPANIEDAKEICSKAIQTEDNLEEARKQFQEYKQKQQAPSSGR